MWFRVGWICLLALAVCSCQAFVKRLSKRLTHSDTLGQEALEDPIQAVGGDGMLFVPMVDSSPLSRKQLATATPETLAAYYAPIFVQQRRAPDQPYPYPPEYDMIGEAHLKHEADGKLKSYVTGQPKVYVIFRKQPIEGADHVQLTYTAWYPAHPRLKKFDLEAADIDSTVLRVTLDADNVPLFYETIMACGCFHKVFVERWIEDAARQVYGAPEQGKTYCVEHAVHNAVEWEVGGLVDEPRDQPRRPVVFLKAGEHKVLGLGSAARLCIPPKAETYRYEMTSYAELYAVTVDGTGEQAGFFDMENGGKVRGGVRKREKFLMSFVGVDSAGQPRADDQIKMHFDQSAWGDPTIYGKYLRLPPGLFHEGGNGSGEPETTGVGSGR
jgi:hypothetical protein